MPRLTVEAAARLRTAMRPHKVTLELLAEALGIGRTTAHRMLSGEADTPERFELFVTTRLGTTVDYILHGEQQPAEGIVEVPIYDVEVAAGSGRVPLGEEPIGAWPFPRDFIARFAGADLALVRVAGDSQEPELRDGDMVMIDRAEARLRDGMAVVRLDDRLLIKRVQVQGATVLLRSANSAYADIPVEVFKGAGAQDVDFAVVGRAVWAGKLL